jgi:hypothetical protein
VQPVGCAVAARASRDTSAMTDTATKAVITDAVFISSLLERAAYLANPALSR